MIDRYINCAEDSADALMARTMAMMLENADSTGIRQKIPVIASMLIAVVAQTPAIRATLTVSSRTVMKRNHMHETIRECMHLNTITDVQICVRAISRAYS